MARIHPVEIGEIVYSEATVLNQLSRLSDDWHIFHSISWQGLRRGRQGDGEADFIVVNPLLGAAVLEVKGGNISITDGQWFSKNREGKHKIKNPFEQAKDSKYTLIKFLENLTDTSRYISVCHGVIFPNITYFEKIGLYGSKEIVCDSQGLLDIESYLISLFEHWGCGKPISSSDLPIIIHKISPSVSMTRRLVDKINNAEAEIIHLTDEQIVAMSAIRYVPRALITGTAGSGKTVLAEALINWYQEDELLKKVLYVCYNPLLAEKMAGACSIFENVECRSYFSLAHKLLRKGGVEIPLLDGEWEHDVTDLLIRSLDDFNPSYDAILIDEAQDFDSDWIYALWLMVIEKGGRIIVFGDSHQELYDRSWTLPEDLPIFPLTKNCRNTKNIAAKAEKSIGVKSPEVLGPKGPMPVYLEAESTEDQIDVILSVVESLVLDEQISPGRIVILTDRPAIRDRLREHGPGGTPITSYGKFGVAAETIRRFKGLDAEVVILCISSPDALQSDDLRKLAYVGLSRAKSMLYVIGAKKMKRIVGW